MVYRKCKPNSASTKQSDGDATRCPRCGGSKEARMYVTKEAIEQVRRSHDIVQVVRSYGIELKHRF